MKIVPIPDAHLKNLFGPAGDILEKLNSIESLLPVPIKEILVPGLKTMSTIETIAYENEPVHIFTS